ncbi:hypothetical protein TNCV_2619921 [Trichonephila clavipes]|uniref:Uncharacterized protein n=1 Tax=Trichonephila clavipes TaxID=2585209 RepID=A0A8X7BLL2_TRICX|nr:hypothetical protein TNCV_2619921 [Trichonephila clavipes]
MDEANNFPLAAPVVLSDCYMDDILLGSESIEEEYAFLESDETKALGIIWNPKLDCFLLRKSNKGQLHSPKEWFCLLLQESLTLWVSSD